MHVCTYVHMFIYFTLLDDIIYTHPCIHAYMHTCTHVTYISTCIQGTVKTQVDDLSGECSFVSGKCTKHCGAIGPPKRNIYNCAKCPHLKLLYTKLLTSATGATRYSSDTVAIPICSKCSPRPQIDPFHPFPPFLFPSYSGMRYSASFFLPFSFLFLFFLSFSFPFSFLFLSFSLPLLFLFLSSSCLLLSITQICSSIFISTTSCAAMGPHQKRYLFLSFYNGSYIGIRIYNDIHVYTRIGGIYVYVCIRIYMHAFFFKYICIFTYTET